MFTGNIMYLSFSLDSRHGHESPEASNQFCLTDAPFLSFVGELEIKRYGMKLDVVLMDTWQLISNSQSVLGVTCLLGTGRLALYLIHKTVAFH